MSSTYTRPASADETHRHLSGYGPAIPGAVETDHGLMVVADTPPRYWALLWGGPSYIWGDCAEPFESLAEIAATYDDRRRDRYYPTWGDADRPVIGETARVGLIWYHREGGDRGEDYPGGYPAATLELGPRGGLRVVPA